ncbi:MAG: N-acetylmuramoyl-L-alanine amidase [Phycisphaerales bacterium]|nr:N-acetylmuramoyl-L-alanine amidase [Phycisphaerales bacterium]
MHNPVNQDLHRRQVLAGLLGLGGAFVLTGCQGAGGWKPLTRDELDGPIQRPNPYSPRRPLGTPRVPVEGVIARREWTANGPIMALANPMNGIQRITVHHDGMNVFQSTSRGDAAQRLEIIRKAHISQHWADIGYHYIIDPAGRVWEGRPIALQGAHVKDQNEHNVGVMVMGNFEESRPTSAALTTLDLFVGHLMQRYRVPIGRVYTHRELGPTACPGRNLQTYMVATRATTGHLARA